MAQYAKVESLDALKELRTFLCSLGPKIAQSLDEADYDVQNTLNWLKNDQYPYWKNQVSRRREELVKAKLELKRKQSLDQLIDAGGKSYVDEKKTMAIAQRRLEHAEGQIKKVHKWVPELEKQMFECRAALQGLAVLIQNELPKKRTQIDQMIFSLESYMDVTAPEFKTPAGMVPVERGDDMSKPVQQGDEKSCETIQDIYRLLRDRNPFNSLKDEIHSGASEIVFFDLKNDPGLDAIGASSRIDRKVREDITILIDESIHTSDFIFSEKITVADDGKTNVYIAPVEIHLPACYLSYRVSDFLKWNPTWQDIFLLPSGWMTFFKAKKILSIFDADECIIYEFREGFV